MTTAIIFAACILVWGGFKLFQMGAEERQQRLNETRLWEPSWSGPGVYVDFECMRVLNHGVECDEIRRTPEGRWEWKPCPSKMTGGTWSPLAEESAYEAAYQRYLKSGVVS